MSRYTYLKLEVVLEVEADDEELAHLTIHKALDRLPDYLRTLRNTRKISPAPEYVEEF